MNCPCCGGKGTQNGCRYEVDTGDKIYEAVEGYDCPRCQGTGKFAPSYKCLCTIQSEGCERLVCISTIVE